MLNFPTETLDAPSSTTSAYLAAAAQRQQQEAARGGGSTPSYHYVVDVPVSKADIDRRHQQLQEGAPQLPPPHLRPSPFLAAESVLALSEESQRQEAVHKLAPLPSFNPSSVVFLPATKLLKLRREWLPHRQRFPLQQQRIEFLDTLLNSAVVGVVGGPGSGKTLQIPLILSENEAFKRRRILVVSATEVAAKLTTRRLREERGEDVVTSRTVAAALPLHQEATEGSTIVVTTAEVLLRQLLCDPTLLGVGVVLFDDVHLRDERTELCFSLLRDLMVQEAKAAAAAANSGGGSSSGGGGNTASKQQAIRVIVNSVEESAVAPVMEFFHAQRTAVFTVAMPPASHAVLYVEEALQWLKACEKEGPFVCTDTTKEIAKYADDVDVVSRVMEVTETDFTSVGKLQSVWCDLAWQCVEQYDRADRARSAAGAPLSALVVIAPNPFVLQMLRDELDLKSDALQRGLQVHLLSESETSFQTFVDIAANKVVADGEQQQQRCLLLATPEVALTVLPSSFPIGLVVDLARQTQRTLDLGVMCDHSVTQYAAINALRHRRTLSLRPDSMVVQLIPKSILHSAQHRRQNTDAAQHILFQLSLERYVRLYETLQAREEAVRHTGFGHQNDKDGLAATVAGTIATLAMTHFVGMPPFSHNRYEHLKRVLTLVESNLFAAGHLTADVAGVRLSPIGVAACCVPLPTTIVRTLCFAPLFQCTLEATLIAALWSTTDLFEGRGGAGVSAEQLDLAREARSYFSRNALSDVVASFNVYKMWVSMRSSPEDEADFLVACGASKASLEAISATHAALYCRGRQLGLFPPLSGSKNEEDEHVHGVAEPDKVWSAPREACVAFLQKRVKALSDEAVVLRAPVLGCLTAVLYPHCVVPSQDGAAFLLDGSHYIVNRTATKEDGTAVVAATGTAAAAARLGVFGSRSELSSSDENVQRAAGSPFLYVSKHVAASRTGEVVAPVAVLDYGVPLEEGAALAFCGEIHERPKNAPLRCRGWTPVLTNAWRQTKKARLLPPPAQLPPVSIPLLSYDTIHAKNVVVTTDHNLHFTMRATSAQWIRQFRNYTQCFLYALVHERGYAPASFAAELGEAWRWWDRRRTGGREWLREERSTPKEGSAAHSTRKLYGYYLFDTAAGKPQPMQPPADAEKLADREAEAAAKEDDAANQPTVFQGKRPPADMEELFRTCVESVAESGSRDVEVSLLRDQSNLFSFLDPDDEYHEYYLYLLRQAAPDMEILGDDLEELVQFLEKLEEELRTELGLPDPALQQPEVAPVPQGDYQVEELEATATYNGDGGVQMEEAAVSYLKAGAGAGGAAAAAEAQKRQQQEQQQQQQEEEEEADPTAVDQEAVQQFDEDEMQQQQQQQQEHVLPLPSGAPGTTASSPPPPPTPVLPEGGGLLSAESILASLQAMQGGYTAPSTAELMALLGAPVAGTVGGEEEEALEEPTNPLAVPPPPLPAKVVEERAPSVLVYPILDRKYGNVPLLMVRALGDTLGMRVGPALLIGNVARISVPNRAVQERALELKHFSCMGEKLYLFRNDRIIDNPTRMTQEGERRGFKRGNYEGRDGGGGDGRGRRYAAEVPVYEGGERDAPHHRRTPPRTP